MSEIPELPLVLKFGEGKTFHGTGTTITLKAVGPRAGGDFVFIEYTAPPNWIGPHPHVHRRHEELFYVVAGEFEFLVDDQRVLAPVGTFIRVPPGMLHAFQNRTDVEARWIGTVAPHDFQAYFLRLAEAIGTAAEPDREAIEHLRREFDTNDRDVGGWP
jgi:uncharacterized cupin superfamily protein